jgi:type 1 glutamine amidotransferase
MWSGTHRLAWFVILAALAACGDNFPGQPVPPPEAGITAPPDARPLGAITYVEQGQPGRPRVLVYTYESYWRHYSNIDAFLSVTNMVNTRGFTVALTNDPLALNATNLANYDVVVFAVTSGTGLNSLCQHDLEAWIRAGGGVVAFHSATATEWNWDFYTHDLMGTSFAGHINGLYPATVKVVSSTHPITAGLPDLHLTDEWYFFRQRPETVVPKMDMLLVLDEDSLPPDYPALAKQGFHPIGWAHENVGGRVFYFAAGHAQASWQDPTFVEIVGRAIEWAAHQR